MNIRRPSREGVSAKLRGDGRFVLSRRHFVPAYVKTFEEEKLRERAEQAVEALPVAIEGGLRLPLVYNTSAYDSLESLRLMDGVVDIYMPDFKLWNADHCAKYLTARDYSDAARAAIAVMHEQVGELKVDEQGLALRGVLVRHLVMPGLLDDTREIMGWLAAACSRDTYVNVMDQYRPAFKAETESRFTAINRRLHDAEYELAMEYARAAGLWRFDTRGG